MSVGVGRHAVWLVALLGVACSQEPRSAPEPVQEIESAPLKRFDVPSREQPQEPLEPGPAAAPAVVAQKPPPAGKAEDIQLGMSRQELSRVLGNCAARVTFIRPAPTRKSVEVLQPRPGECLERFGARRFTVVSGKLERIDPGLDEASVEHSASPTQETASDHPR